MRWIQMLENRLPSSLRIRRPQSTAVVGLLLIALLVAPPSHAKDRPEEEAQEPPDNFDVVFDIGLVPCEKSAHVLIELGAGSQAVEWIQFSFDANRHRAIEANGTLEEVEGKLRWTPPATGAAPAEP